MKYSIFAEHNTCMFQLNMNMTLCTLSCNETQRPFFNVINMDYLNPVQRFQRINDNEHAICNLMQNLIFFALYMEWGVQKLLLYV